MRKLLIAGTVTAVMAGLLIAAPGNGAFGAPPTNPAVTNATYQQCFRVFSDQHAFWPSPTQAPNRSPYAKGAAACAAQDFLYYTDVFLGTPPAVPSAMDFLEGLFPRFIEFYKLEQDFPGPDGPDNCATTTDPEDICSAGLPRQGVPQAPPGSVASNRLRSDLFMVRVTDETVPEAGKKFFVYAGGMHAIEKAGTEADPRAAEDLATWAYCEAVAGFSQTPQTPNGLTNCAMEAPIPHPVLETQPLGPQNLSAGDVLEQASIYFVFPNPDGWRRGDPDNLARAYSRYNGNGVDLNRDWVTQGFTNRPYTPWSEPETRGLGTVLKGIRSKWDGGIDLHGQLNARAFSFTLLGATERDYAKDQRILQFVKGAWADAEDRLGWHALIVPNDQPRPTEAHMYGVQWGTVWDTINYQVTGAFGDWIDSPIGLNGDGIDNEMSLSHLSNCGTGSCYLPDFEQLHVDGNKALVYAHVNYSLLPEDTNFEAPGKVGYILDPAVLSNPGSGTPTPPPNLPPQPDQLNVLLNQSNNFRYQFEVFGPDSTPTPYYNGGIVGTATAVNIAGLSGLSATSSVIIERQQDDGDPAIGEDAGCGAANDDWLEVNRYFNQASTYAQAGQAVHANSPLPGQWRICVTGGVVANAGSLGFIDLDITFSGEQAWPDPGQLPYSVSNMNFFEDLAPFMDPGQLVPIQVSDVVSGPLNLMQFSSIVIADNPAPGLTDPSPELTTYKDKLVNFVKRGGNLVLTDGALRLLGTMGFVAPSAIAKHHVYAGYLGFTRDGGATDTYADPLATNINQPGAAEGSGHRHQTFEPVPLGFDIGSRTSCSGQPPPTGPATQCTSPVWTVLQSAWEAPLQGANSRTVGQINANFPGGGNRAGFGELQLGCGRVRIMGALIPMPTERYYHPFGLANYAVTYSGYQAFKNLLQWNRPRITSRRTSIPNPC
jgi:hypothetical protein